MHLSARRSPFRRSGVRGAVAAALAAAADAPSVVIPDGLSALPEPAARTVDVTLRVLTNAANKGVLWFGVAAVGSLLGKRPRRAAVRGLLSLGAASLTANVLIKPFVSRGRPGLERTALARRLGQRAAHLVVPQRPLRLGRRVRHRSHPGIPTGRAGGWADRGGRGLLPRARRRAFPFGRHRRARPRRGHRAARPAALARPALGTGAHRARVGARVADRRRPHGDRQRRLRRLGRCGGEHRECVAGRQGRAVGRGDGPRRADRNAAGGARRCGRRRNRRRGRRRRPSVGAAARRLPRGHA